MQQEEASKVVTDMAEQRQAAAKPEMSILDAIDDAQWLRRTPDGQVTADRLRRICDTLLSALERSPCYFNAVRRGQETFVLVSQDRAAPHAIMEWVQWAERHGCPDSKCEQAAQTAQKWINQPTTATKWPD